MSCDLGTLLDIVGCDEDRGNFLIKVEEVEVCAGECCARTALGKDLVDDTGGSWCDALRESKREVMRIYDAQRKAIETLSDLLVKATS